MVRLVNLSHLCYRQADRFFKLYICIELYDCVYVISLFELGSFPPSPADSGVSDVDSSSSGGQSCSDELKARLGLPAHCANLTPHLGAGTFLHPTLYPNSNPLRNIWNRGVASKYRKTVTRGCVGQSNTFDKMVCNRHYNKRTGLTGLFQNRHISYKFA